MLPENADETCQWAVKKHGASSAISWLLMASYLYYHFEVSLLSDSVYDSLGALVLAEWETVKHPHKVFITEDDLRAGTLYNLPSESYPTIIRDAAVSVLTRITSQSLSDEELQRIRTEPFKPIEAVWDTYFYGEGLTWRDYQRSLTPIRTRTRRIVPT